MPAGEHSLPNGPKLLSVPEAPKRKSLGTATSDIVRKKLIRRHLAKVGNVLMFLLFNLRSERYEDVFYTKKNLHFTDSYLSYLNLNQHL